MSIELPKGYLSYSALSTWKSAPDMFRARYYEGAPYLSTPYTEFGNKVGNALETGNLFHSCLEEVPRYDVMEKKLEVEIEGVPFLMYLDSFDSDTLAIAEYKTGIIGPGGREPWDRVKVRKHIQLPIYALGVREQFGDWNPDLKLVWMETKWSTVDHETKFQDQTFLERRPGLKLTGRVETFERTIAEWELDRMATLIRTAAEEITEDYKIWKKTATSKK